MAQINLVAPSYYDYNPLTSSVRRKAAASGMPHKKEPRMKSKVLVFARPDVWAAKEENGEAVYLLLR